MAAVVGRSSRLVPEIGKTAEGGGKTTLLMMAQAPRTNMKLVVGECPSLLLLVVQIGHLNATGWSIWMKEEMTDEKTERERMTRWIDGEMIWFMSPPRAQGDLTEALMSAKE